MSVGHKIQAFGFVVQEGTKEDLDKIASCSSERMEDLIRRDSAQNKWEQRNKQHQRQKSDGKCKK